MKWIGAFSEELEKYDNVFLDLQLVEHPRPDLPKAYLSRILFNEQILKEYSLPLNNNRSLLVFHSLEPVLNEFISSAHPAIVNVLADDDDVTRMFPLYYTYKMSDGTVRNLLTATLLLGQTILPREKQRYFHHAGKGDSLPCKNTDPGSTHAPA